MMKHGKLLSVALVIVLLCTLFTACTGSKPVTPAQTSSAAPVSPSASESAKPAEKQLLKVWLINQTPLEKEFYDAFAEKNPDIDYELSMYESQDYKNQIRVAVAGNTAPDVMLTNMGLTFQEYINMGAVYDMTDVYKEKNWGERTYKELEDANSVNGKIYGINTTTMNFWQTVYYNKTMLDGMGITLPTQMTIEEFAKVANQVKDNKMQPIAFGDIKGWPAVLMLGDYFMQIEDPSIVQKINSGELKWDTAEQTKKAVDAMVRLAQSGSLTVGWEAQDHLTAIQSWVGGKTAMLYNGTWWQQNVDGGVAGVPFEVGTMNLPLIDSNTQLKGTQFWGSMVMFINSKTQVLDAAVRYVDYFTGEEKAKVQAEAQKIFTAHPKINETIELHPVFKTEAFTNQLTLPKMNYLDQAFPTPVIEAMKIQLQKAMMGEITVDEALKAIETAHAAERK